MTRCWVTRQKYVGNTRHLKLKLQRKCVTGFSTSIFSEPIWASDKHNYYTVLEESHPNNFILDPQYWIQYLYILTEVLWCWEPCAGPQTVQPRSAESGQHAATHLQKSSHQI